MTTPTQSDATLAARKLRFNRFGLAENPANLHCTLHWRGRRLLGEILRADYNSTLGHTLLTVRHMNGELWPIKPSALAVEVLQ
jgi:hypothetical protein